jgi:hypothetical protein
MKKVNQSRYGWYIGNVVQPRDQIADRSLRLQSEKVVQPNKLQIRTARDGRQYEYGGEAMTDKQNEATTEAPDEQGLHRYGDHYEVLINVEDKALGAVIDAVIKAGGSIISVDGQ